VDVTGVKFFAGGKEVTWRRIRRICTHLACEVPVGAETLEATLDYLLPQGIGGRRGVASSTAQIAGAAMEFGGALSQGTKSDDVNFSAKLRIPAGMEIRDGATGKRKNRTRIEFETVFANDAGDSPVLRWRVYERRTTFFARGKAGASIECGGEIARDGGSERGADCGCSAISCGDGRAFLVRGITGTTISCWR